MPHYCLGGLGGQKEIDDRVAKWQSFPDSQLRAIISTYGGEMGQAAQIILNQRAGTAAQVQPGGAITVPTGSVTVKVPDALTPQVQVSPGAFDFKNPIVLAGIAAAAVVLGLVLTRRG